MGTACLNVLLGAEMVSFLDAGELFGCATSLAVGVLV